MIFFQSTVGGYRAAVDNSFTKTTPRSTDVWYIVDVVLLFVLGQERSLVWGGSFFNILISFQDKSLGVSILYLRLIGNI